MYLFQWLRRVFHIICSFYPFSYYYFPFENILSHYVKSNISIEGRGRKTLLLL